MEIFNSISALGTPEAFGNNFASNSDKYAPKKTKILRGNKNFSFLRFTSKGIICKQIMIRLRLRNKAKILVTLSSLSENEHE